MSIIKRIARRAIAALVCCAALVVAPSPTASAADVEPLRSADLDAQLKRAGFDDAQRATLLADHAGYVTRFTAVVADRIGEWQSLARTFPNTVEDARALQSKARAAAQAIDDAERPLLDAIRTAARADQGAAAERVIALLEIRRDLAFASTMREGLFSGRSVDVIEALDAMQFSSEITTKLQPQLTQYLAERQRVVHRIRDAALNVPLRRAEAKLSNPRPAQPAEIGGENHDAARMRTYIEEVRASTSAMHSAANAERTEAQVKSIELDLRTLDSLLPLLTPRDQVHLLSRWWLGAGVMAHSIGPGPCALKRAWNTPSDRVTPEIATQLDAVCAEWIAAWWPNAKAMVINLTSNWSGMLFGIPDSDKSSPKEERAIAATTHAVQAIDLALDGHVSESTAAKARGEIAGQVAAQSVGVFVASEMADAIEISSDNIVFEGGMLEFDGGFEISEVSFEAVGGGGFAAPSPLPQLMQFDEIKPALAAAGVDASMMEVAKTAVDDLLSEAGAIVQEAQALQSGGDGMFDGMLEKRSDGTLRPVDPAVRAQRSAQRNALRARLLALEAAKLDEILAAVVPETGRPCVAWLAPWRQFVSARTASATGDFFGMGQPQLDPTQAVRSAKFSAQDLCAIGIELAAICTDLAARAQAVAAMRAKVSAAMPTPVITGEGTEVEGINLSADSSQDLMRFEGELQKLQHVARTATHESIARLKTRLPADAAQRLQDAWDDQLYARDLRDPTQLTSRFESALAMTLSDAVRAQVVALQTSWTNSSRTTRDKIVALKSSAQSDSTAPEAASRAATLKAERKAQLNATTFERDETNRRFFRELCELLGAELGAKLRPLPEGKSKRIGGGIPGASFSFTSPAPAP